MPGDTCWTCNPSYHYSMVTDNQFAENSFNKILIIEIN